MLDRNWSTFYRTDEVREHSCSSSLRKCRIYVLEEQGATRASIALIEYCGITVYAYLRVKEFVIVIQVRCGGLNPRLKSGVPNHTVTLEDEVTIEKEMNGTAAFHSSRITGGVALGTLAHRNIIMFWVAILNPVQSMDANRKAQTTRVPFWELLLEDGCLLSKMHSRWRCRLTCNGRSKGKPSNKSRK